MVGIPAFSLVTGGAVHSALDGCRDEIIDLVAETYLLHGRGNTVNPPSYFLRFPDRPSARIIALPASVGGGVGVDGIKWISSFPTNLEHGIPRASAVLVLNDPTTGYPFACLESSIISAVRTAASATVAARELSANRRPPRRVGFVGTGLIARYQYDYLTSLGWGSDVLVYDLEPEYATAFADHVTASGGVRVQQAGSAEELIRASDVVVFATTAAQPHVTDPSWFDHHPLVLHVSLRDLGTEVILGAVNVVDDVDHVLKAQTSVHLAEQHSGGRDFIHATLYDVLAGTFAPPPDRTVIFSPFGLGVLDLAVGAYVHDRAGRTGDLITVDNFFHDLDRHRAPERTAR